MRQNHKREEINPWTFRHRSTLDSFQQLTSDRPQQELPFEQRPKITPINPPPHRPTQQAGRTRVEIPEHLDRFQRYRIPTVSLQKSALEHVQKTLAVSFQTHFRPLKCKSNQTRFCFVSSPHRWNSQPAEDSSKIDNKKKSSHDRIMKFKRYYTEERDQREGEEGDRGLFADLLSINPLSLPSNRPGLPVKIMRTSKKKHAVAVTRGRLFEEVMTICHDKNISGGGHLSQMKRTYNLKKLQRLIKPAH